MPPRIQSLTPDSEEIDELQDDTSPPRPPPPPSTKIKIQARRPQPPPAAVPQQPVHVPVQGDDEDELSSLSDSNEGDGDDDDDEMMSEDPEPAAYDEGEAYSEGGDDVAEDDELDELEEDDEEEFRPPLASKKRAGGGGSGASAAASGSAGMKIKFKVGGTAGPSPADIKGKNKSGGRSSKGKAKGKSTAGKYTTADFDDEDELSGSDELSGYGSASSSQSGASSARLTARQRAKEMGGEFDLGLQSLPNPYTKHKYPEKLSEAEIALRRTENLRKRRHQADKKLEDEKTETINRLLKKQVGRQRSKLSTSTVAGAISASGPGRLGVAPVQTPAGPPVMSRWVSSTKSGEYKAVFALPVGRSEIQAGALGVEGRQYPGPRPPLKTRRLEKGVAVA